MARVSSGSGRAVIMRYPRMRLDAEVVALAAPSERLQLLDDRDTSRPPWGTGMLACATSTDFRVTRAHGGRLPRRAAPLREHTFRIAGLVISMVVSIASFAIVLLLLNQGRAIPASVLTIALPIVIAIAGAGIAIGLLLGRRIVGDRIEVAFRDPGGKWRHGRLSVGHRRVVLQPYLWQLRIPSGESREFEVVDLGEDTGRRPPLRQLWSVNPQLHIVELETDRGQFEIAGLPSHLTELRERLDER